MPLSFVGLNQPVIVDEVKGKSEIKKRLNELGFVEGQQIKVVGENHGNLLIGIKHCRIALSKEIALKIIVKGE